MPEENQSVGHVLHEEGQISWLNPSGSMPEGLRENPMWATWGYALGYALGLYVLSKIIILLYDLSN